MNLNEAVDNQPNPNLNPRENLGSVNSDKKVEAKRNLEILLGDKNIDPERAEEIRKQIQAIDNGEVAAIQESILKQSDVVDSEHQGLNHELLADALNGKIDLSQMGSEHDITKILMESAKKRAQESKS